MGESRNWLLAAIVAVALSFGMAACADVAPEGADSGVPSDVAGGATGGEAVGAEVPAEEAGEGGEGGEEGEGEHGESGEGGEGEEGEHGEGGEGEEGEESGEMIARTATWDKVSRGARLVLSFNAERNAFVGTVTNTTEQTLCAVRVEVHLEGGPELGPTEQTDVPAGGTTDVVLPTEGESFTNWTAHPEMSACGSRLKEQDRLRS
jgi:hypothetical protein